MRSGNPLPADFADAFTAAADRLLPLGHPVIFFDTIGSTNDEALALAAEGCGEGAVILADQQTAGRGRYGRAWFSPPASGLYVSIVLQPARGLFDRGHGPGPLTLAAGVALAEAIEAATGLHADIKWPNDLHVGRRKLAGILAETGPCGAVILGYGINIGSTSFPSELVDRATSIESELGRPTDRATLCVETLAAVSARYRDLLSGRFDAILEAWRNRSPTGRGARVTWSTPQGRQSGVTVGIDDRGALIVQTGDRTECIFGGEVTWV
jgi:BirA family transcriptional regulator, biotin operon repressor / biotin---[acetyl-CoA-carboxylase] ligase